MIQIKKWGMAITIFAILLFVPLSFVHAFQFKAGEQMVTIPKGETINEDVFVAGQKVNIEGIINGDVFAAASDVTVSGKVLGSVIVGAGTVTISGSVENDLIVGAGAVNITGEVKDNVIAGAGTLVVSSDAQINHGVLAGLGVLNIDGKVGDLNVTVEKATISGKVSSDVNLKANEEIQLAPSTEIGGNFNYKSPNKIEIPAGAKILGETKWQMLEKAKVTPGIFQFFSLLPKLSLIILGLLAVLLLPKPSRRVINLITKTPGKSFGWGILAVLVTPIACIIACITLIGLSLGIVGFILLAVALYVSQALFGLFVGEKILKLFIKEREVSLLGAVVLGNLVVIVVSFIPYLGGLILIIGSLFAFGALLLVKKEQMLLISGRKSKEVVS